MREKYLKTTLSTVEVENVYKYEVKADIDGANEVIGLHKHHFNAKNKIDETEHFYINYADLKKLMRIIEKHAK